VHPLELMTQLSAQLHELGDHLLQLCQASSIEKMKFKLKNDR
jgi:hypothetical protein